MADMFGIQPGVEGVHAQKQRQKEQRHQRQGHRARLQQMANHPAPATANQVVYHEQPQTAQADFQPKDIGHQIGLPELRLVEKRAHQCQRQPHHPDDECRCLQPFEGGIRCNLSLHK